MKKNKKVGYNGSIRTNIDSRGRFGFGGDINLRQEKVKFLLSGNLNQRKSISTGNTDRTTFGNPNSQLTQDDKSMTKGTFGFGRGGFDYFINNRNTLSVTGNFVKGSMNPNNTSTMQTDLLGTPMITSLAERNSVSKNNFRNVGTMIGYKHNFPKTGKEFTADFTFNQSRSNSSNFITTRSPRFQHKEHCKIVLSATGWIGCQ